MSSAEAAAPSPAVELASALIAGTCSIPEDLNDSQREALAWALKDEAIARCTTHQIQIPGIESALRELTDAASPRLALTLKPILSWVAGLAAIAEGRMSDADAALQAAAAGFREVGHSGAAAQTQIPRVLVLCMQGKLGDAETCGLAARDELLGLGDTHAASRVSLNLGQLSCERSNFRAAIAHFESAAAGFREADDQERAVQSSIGLADALASTGAFDAALKRYASAHDDASAGGWPVLAALCNELSALVRLAQGDYAAALAGFEQARGQYERLQMPQHLANIERQLGETYLELHLLPEARRLLHATIARFEHLGMRLEAAWTRIELAKTFAGQRTNDPYIEAELSAAEHVFAIEKQRAGQATAVVARAEHAMRLGDVVRARELATSAAEEFGQLHMLTSEARARALIAVCEWHDHHASSSREAFAWLLALARESGLLSIELCALTHLGYVASPLKQ